MNYYDLSLKNKKKFILTRIENFYDYHSIIKKILSDKSLKLQLKKLTGENVHLFKDKINFKLPGSKGFKPHQDATIWKNMYGIKSFLTMVISVDKSNIRNGCLEFSKYKKKRLISKSWKEIPKKVEKKLTWETIKTNPGDVIFFHDYTPHRSADNLSSKKRRMIFLTFNKKRYGDFRKKHFHDKRKNYPPNIERDPNKDYTFHV